MLKQKSVARSPSAKPHGGRPGSETSSLVSDFSEACSSHSEGEQHIADGERYGEAEVMYKKLRR